jgi:ABC-type lipoprotein release transport system permease subunit
MMLWRMAWRNLWRNRGRTLIMGSAVALAFAFLLFGMAVNDYAHERMLTEAARAAGGDVLVHAGGYWDTRASDLVIPGGSGALATVRRLDGVQAAIPRVLATGLMSTSADNRPVVLQGIDPELEAALNDHGRKVREGTFLDGERRDGIVLGSRLAGRLDAGIGDRVVLTATRPDGEMTRALFHLTGIIETGTRELDEVLGFTTLEAAQRALGMGDAITQVGVVASPGANVDSLRATVAAALDAAGNGMEVLTWSDAVPEMIGLMEMDAVMDTIYMALIFVVVLFSITNTFMMAVMERVREFGLLNALGLRHEAIGRLMLRETVLLTAVAMAAGLALGLVAHMIVSRTGISMAAMGMEDIEMAGLDVSDMVIYSLIKPMKWVITSAIVALATVASALYPAWRATRLAPAEAMRFYE